MKHIQVRFNTRANGSPLVWRVVIDGQENLAENIKIIGKCYGEKSIVDGETKYNIACNGTVTWEETTAIINAE